MTALLPRIDYRSHPAYGGMFEPDEELRAQALSTLEPLVEEMALIETDRQERFGYRYGFKEALGEQLARDGGARLELQDREMDDITREARPLIDLVRERIAETRAKGAPVKYRTVLESLDKSVHTDLWNHVEAAYRNAGVLDICAAFFNAPGAKVRGMGLLVNQANQDWATKLFRDLPVEAPPTAGFHIDSNGKCFVKTVLYLNDVGPDQGPFGFVPGSHRWEEGSRARTMRRAFDKSPFIARSARERQMFISLPPEMQVKAEFGGDMLADSEECRSLIAQERPSHGPRGTLNLFDPEAIHRGGNVRSGERIVLLVTTGPMWPSPTN